VRYSIVTPTLVRSSLIRACQSIDSQIDKSYEHIVIVDLETLTSDQRRTLAAIEHPQRRILYCGMRHCDYGNTCRRAAIAQAKGDYILMLDDDHYADTRVLETLRCVTQSWALYPNQAMWKDLPRSVVTATEW